jgi:hypothetical protein
MARFLALKFRAGSFWLAAGIAGAMAFLLPSMRAAQPTPSPAPIPGKPATALAPVHPPDAMGQYGKIVTASDQTAHPLKLKMPFPGVGEVKIPSQDELTMRVKLEQLAMLTDAEIRAQLEKWPAYGSMSLRDQGSMLQRIQDFRDYRSNVAKTKAHDMGLLTLLPDQQARFEKDYWDKRLQMDHDLAKQFEPIFRAREQKMQDELYREFSLVAAGPAAQVPKPVKKPPQPVAGLAQSKPADPASSSAMVNPTQPMQPMAQAPR